MAFGYIGCERDVNANCVDERALVGFVQVIAYVGVHIPSHIAGIGYLGYRMYIVNTHVQKNSPGYAISALSRLKKTLLSNNNQSANCFYQQQLFFV